MQNAKHAIENAKRGMRGAMLAGMMLLLAGGRAFAQAGPVTASEIRLTSGTAIAAVIRPGSAGGSGVIITAPSTTGTLGLSTPPGMGDLTDVTLSSLANGDALAWNSGSSRWTNRTPSAMRTLLSLVVGTNVEAWDADLDYLAGVSLAANVKSILNAADYAAIKTLLAIAQADVTGLHTTDSVTFASEALTSTSSAGGTTGGVTFDFLAVTPDTAASTHKHTFRALTPAAARTHTFQDNSGTLYESGGTDVAVADGGTGSSTASGARTNLGLAIGTDVHAQTIASGEITPENLSTISIDKTITKQGDLAAAKLYLWTNPRAGAFTITKISCNASSDDADFTLYEVSPTDWTTPAGTIKAATVSTNSTGIFTISYPTDGSISDTSIAAGNEIVFAHGSVNADQIGIHIEGHW